MKKYLKFSGIVAALFALVAFILLLATPAVMSGSDIVAQGTTVLFGKTETVLIFKGEIKLAWSALLAWIFVIVALVILLVGVILPLLKVKAIEKFAGVLNLCAVALLLVAGVFAFITLPVFASANGIDSVPEQWTLGAGWIIAGILAILGGVCAILPTAVDFLGKKK